MSGSKSYGIGDLPAASTVSDTDSIAICQSANGCHATDSTVTLHQASQAQLVSYYRAKFIATAPITYDGNGNFGLAIDPATLAVHNGVLTVIGGGVTPPAGGAPVTGGGAPVTGGGGAPVTGGGAAAVLAADQEAALLHQIAELEARLAALEGKT